MGVGLLFFISLYPQCLIDNLAHSINSINIYGIDKYMDGPQQYSFISLLFSCALSSFWNTTLPILLPLDAECFNMLEDSTLKIQHSSPMRSAPCSLPTPTPKRVRCSTLVFFMHTSTLALLIMLLNFLLHICFLYPLRHREDEQWLRTVSEKY